MALYGELHPNEPQPELGSDGQGGGLADAARTATAEQPSLLSHQRGAIQTPADTRLAELQVRGIMPQLRHINAGHGMQIDLAAPVLMLENHRILHP